MSEPNSDAPPRRQVPVKSLAITCDNTVSDTSFITGKQNHFPYTCPESHCILNEERCQNKCCMEEITERIKDFRDIISRCCMQKKRLLAEIEGLNEENGSLWERVDPGNPEIASGSPNLYGLCKPSSPAGPCSSCLVESLFRNYQSLQLSIAVHQQQLENRLEYDRRKKDGEDRLRQDLIAESSFRIKADKTRIYANKQQAKISPLERQFADLKEEISKLAVELELLSGEQPRYHTEFLITIEDSHMEASMMLQTNQCSCKSCKFDQKIRNHELAVARAKKHKFRLSWEIKHRQDVQSSLEMAFLQASEVVERGFGFARTGSCRGFGTGDLKPRHQMNPNPKPADKSEGNSKPADKSEGDGKTVKKPKKKTKKPKKPKKKR